MEQNRLERTNLRVRRVYVDTAIHNFCDLISYMYKQQNTNFIWENRGNFNWQDISSIIEFLIMTRILFRARNNLSNLSEVFGDGQRQNYDSVGAYLEELFKRCEKFARQEKRDFTLFKFKTLVFASLIFVCAFIFFELGFGFVTFKGRSKIAFAMLELGSIMCLVCSFVFVWGIFANVLFSAIFLLRTLIYSIVTIQVVVKTYQEGIRRNTVAISLNKVINSFDKNKGSIKKLIKRIGELECRSRLQNELVQRERQQSVVTNNVKSDINDVPLMVIAEGKVETI